jgi:hypothetical protein
MLGPLPAGLEDRPADRGGLGVDEIHFAHVALERPGLLRRVQVLTDHSCHPCHPQGEMCLHVPWLHSTPLTAQVSSGVAADLAAYTDGFSPVGRLREANSWRASEPEVVADRALHLL